MAGMEGKIKDLQSRIDTFDLNTAKRMIIMSGYEGSEKRNECKRQLYEFFEEEMQIKHYH